jgi:hypothetical protein
VTQSDASAEPLYSPDADALLATVASDTTRGWVRKLAAVAEAPLRRSGARPNSALIGPLIAFAGHTPPQSAALRGALDLLQILIDATDNLTDVEEDAARGVDRISGYAGIPVGARLPLPSLLLGCVVHALHTHFPPPQGGAEASVRLLATLDRMLHGQSAPRESDARVDGSSGDQGALAALPLWVLPPTSPLRAHAPEVEAWGRLVFATSERWQRVHDDPSNMDARTALWHALARLHVGWPTWGPFREGEPLSPTLHLAPTPANSGR